jgi:hypothetical protein
VTDRLREFAYYYPEPYWHADEGNWIKSLLLFFDGVSILLPEYMYGRHYLADPTLAGPLEDLGLLKVFAPEQLLDQEAVERLSELMIELLVSGRFDDLPAVAHFHALSRSRLGWGADIELSEMLVDELTQRGLAKASDDGVSIPLHPDVRTTVLVLLAQIMREVGQRNNMILSPITADQSRVDDLRKVLARSKVDNAGAMVAFDLESVSFNLEHIPLDEVLEFRGEHGAEHRAYMRDIRRFVRELAKSDEASQDEMLADRREELADRADALRRIARKRWRRPLAKFMLGAFGGAWNLAEGNIVGAGTSLGAGLLDLNPDGGNVAGAYSYLFAAHRALARA